MLSGRCESFSDVSPLPKQQHVCDWIDNELREDANRDNGKFHGPAVPQRPVAACRGRLHPPPFSPPLPTQVPAPEFFQPWQYSTQPLESPGSHVPYVTQVRK